MGLPVFLGLSADGVCGGVDPDGTLEGGVGEDGSVGECADSGRRIAGDAVTLSDESNECVVLDREAPPPERFGDGAAFAFGREVSGDAEEVSRVGAGREGSRAGLAFEDGGGLNHSVDGVAGDGIFDPPQRILPGMVVEEGVEQGPYGGIGAEPLGLLGLAVSPFDVGEGGSRRCDLFRCGVGLGVELYSGLSSAAGPWSMIEGSHPQGHEQGDGAPCRVAGRFAAHDERRGDLAEESKGALGVAVVLGPGWTCMDVKCLAERLRDAGSVVLGGVVGAQGDGGLSGGPDGVLVGGDDGGRILGVADVGADDRVGLGVDDELDIEGERLAEPVDGDG